MAGTSIGQGQALTLFQQLLNGMGITTPVTTKQVDSIFQNAKKDENGNVTKDEFMTALLSEFNQTSLLKDLEDEFLAAWEAISDIDKDSTSFSKADAAGLNEQIEALAEKPVEGGGGGGGYDPGSNPPPKDDPKDDGTVKPTVDNVTLTGNETLQELEDGRDAQFDGLTDMHKKKAEAKAALETQRQGVDDKKADYDKALENLDESKFENLPKLKDDKQENDKAITQQENSIKSINQTMQGAIEQRDSADSALGSLKEPVASDYTKEETYVDSEGKTQTRTVVDQAAYSAARQEYEAQKAELEEQKRQAEETIATCNEQLIAAEAALVTLREKETSINNQIQQELQKQPELAKEALDALSAYNTAQQELATAERTALQQIDTDIATITNNIDTYDDAIEKTDESTNVKEGTEKVENAEEAEKIAEQLFNGIDLDAKDANGNPIHMDGMTYLMSQGDLSKYDNESIQMIADAYDALVAKHNDENEEQRGSFLTTLSDSATLSGNSEQFEHVTVALAKNAIKAGDENLDKLISSISATETKAVVSAMIRGLSDDEIIKFADKYDVESSPLADALSDSSIQKEIEKARYNDAYKNASEEAKAAGHILTDDQIKDIVDRLSLGENEEDIDWSDVDFQIYTDQDIAKIIEAYNATCPDGISFTEMAEKALAKHDVDFQDVKVEAVVDEAATKAQETAETTDSDKGDKSGEESPETTGEAEKPTDTEKPEEKFDVEKSKDNVAQSQQNRENKDQMDKITSALVNTADYEQLSKMITDGISEDNGSTPQAFFESLIDSAQTKARQDEHAGVEQPFDSEIFSYRLIEQLKTDTGKNSLDEIFGVQNKDDIQASEQQQVGQAEESETEVKPSETENIDAKSMTSLESTIASLGVSQDYFQDFFEDIVSDISGSVQELEILSVNSEYLHAIEDMYNSKVSSDPNSDHKSFEETIKDLFTSETYLIDSVKDILDDNIDVSSKSKDDTVVIDGNDVTYENFVNSLKNDKSNFSKLIQVAQYRDDIAYISSLYGESFASDLEANTKGVNRQDLYDKIKETMQWE